MDIDWSNIEEAASVSPEEAEHLDSPSGEVCGCGKEMTNGEAEAFGTCYGCYDGVF